MKALIVSFAVMATIAAAAAGTLTIDIYSADGCTGKPAHTFSPKVGTCETRGHKPTEAGPHYGPESHMITTPTEGDLALFYGSTNNCTKKDFPEAVPCGKCAPGEMGEYFMVTCNTAGKYATMSAGCDSTCKTCKHSGHKIDVGACHADKRRDGHDIYFEKIYKGYSFTEKGWMNSTTCAGTPSHEFNMATDICMDRFMYTWSPKGLRL